jgi:type IV pilus assembly protein PilE
MVVVAIVAILASITYPFYQNSIREARRAEAQQLLLDTANRQEQFMLDARSYTTNFNSIGINSDGWNCTSTTCTNNFYSVSIAVNNIATPPSFLITASAVGLQLSDGDITINSQGVKTPLDKWQ